MDFTSKMYATIILVFKLRVKSIAYITFIHHYKLCVFILV